MTEKKQPAKKPATKTTAKRKPAPRGHITPLPAAPEWSTTIDGTTAAAVKSTAAVKRTLAAATASEVFDDNHYELKRKYKTELGIRYTWRDLALSALSAAVIFLVIWVMWLAR